MSKTLLNETFPSSPPHRALCCVDIQLNIIDQAFDTPVPGDRSKYPDIDPKLQHFLAQLTLVCKAFRDTATKRLWANIDSFTVLLAVLPSITTTVKKNKNNCESCIYVSLGSNLMSVTCFTIAHA